MHGVTDRTVEYKGLGILSNRGKVVKVKLHKGKCLGEG